MDLKERPEQLISIMEVYGFRHVMNVKDIYYIERIKNSHNCMVYYCRSSGLTRSIETTMSLSIFEDILPNQFVSANRSTIINIRHVAYYRKDRVIMDFALGQGVPLPSIPLTMEIGHKFIEL